MKKNIHPSYYASAVIKCACGSKTEIGSTVEEISVELCSKCHPFYTGKQKLVDTAGRVERFKKRSALKETASASRLGKQVKKTRQAEKKKSEK